MWEELPIEKELERALIEEFGDSQGKTHYGDYTAARGKIPEVVEEIKHREPNLTDHGTRHIEDVLKQAHQLITPGYLKAREMLALMLSVLFHDTGNIHGREGHEKKISEIYDFVRGKSLPAAKLDEKKTLLAVVGTHGGVARNGSKDTIQDLNPTEPFLRQTIRIQEVAAIMRLADELAEGPQRTSEYLRQEHAFDIASEKYHDYASITLVTIDRGLGRIALTYHINVSTRDGQIDTSERERLKRLVEFAYFRIVKVDEERQYAKYYSADLGVFKRTSATFHFWLDNQQVDLELEPLELTDLVVPGSSGKEIAKIDEAYDIDTIINKLKSSCIEV